MKLRHLPLPVLFLLGLPGLAQTRITAVRFWSLGEVTRIAIETDDEATYRWEKLDKPDRLFFDLEGVRPQQSRGIETIPVGDRWVKQIRIARTAPAVARVVLDLNGPVTSSVSQLTNPNRIMIEVRSAEATAAAPPVRSVTGGRAIEDAPAADNKLPETKPEVAKEPAPDPPPVAKPVEKENPKPEPPPFRAPQSRPSPMPPVPEAPQLTQHPVTASVVVRPAAPQLPEVKPVDLPRTIDAKPAETPRTIEAKRGDLVRSPKAEPTRSSESALAAKQDSHGDRSLIRALGLKLNRVAIDAGHGGHDNGSTGPSGLMEKDLVLDIARRLGALITERLGSEVIYTRNDDEFIPLEERTAIANEKAADLFLSIHANSSRVRGVSGPETWYLNFTTSESALEVAARENATSQITIHELQNLVQKIALKEKVQESREFASSMQRYLYSGLVRGKQVKNRGIKQAPFVVLIGAQMPSILAEIGFISNPKDEALLKKSEYRQKVAEALFKGVSQYAGTLSHFQIARGKGVEPRP